MNFTPFFASLSRSTYYIHEVIWAIGKAGSGLRLIVAGMLESIQKTPLSREAASV